VKKKTNVGTGLVPVRNIPLIREFSD